MTATLRISGLSASRGERTLFTDLSLTVAPGDVIGLVGANGAGKSTLLTTLAGVGTADVTGTVVLSPPDATVGYLAQEPERVPGETILGFLGRRTGVTDAEHAMNAAAEALGTTDVDDYTPALERWLALGGADLAERAEKVVADLGLEVGLDAPMTGLSGGQAARAGLAALLLSRYDVLLLDEPTNDLDLAGLDQLERFVAETRTALMVISHDREFLARTVTGIVELDLTQQQIAVYDGGYEAYLVEREVARRHARETYEEYADTKQELEDRARMQRNWLEHGVRNARRKSKDNDKLGKKFRAEATEKQAAKARQTQRRIERLDVVEEPRKEWELRMSIAAAPRSGAVVATLNGARVDRGDFVLGPVTTQVQWGDRIVVTGPNGAGKTTLLRLLLGRIRPDTGTAALGSGVRIGEIDQARALFEGDEPLVDAFAAQVPDWPDAEVRTLLAKFGLRGHHVLRSASSLSPGERTRAGLALLQARGVNLLVLDEPTNHLDLPAIEQLEQAVDSFEGTLLLVTHDRRMLANTRSTRRWHLDGGRLTEEPA
ncbi:MULTISPECIES: ABC-F family ATP-binding cassette domain-containing protein [Rhodococcus]|uniref:ATP-binding cassette domain-containing protein n=1 Tax=Rhodococcus aetherivorans TaxID=191292 RepID=A0AA46PTR4_9NOCA|nr:MULTISPECIES: ABC-F family ATP-binding cassette domain-containing protein [Rhodococcus]ANZ26399.1 heme ABC transporter ATP-binding protein [Rhodococcus sp. WB1]MBC2591399.1 ABC-F family ATP-binding cassette domain-containing protein [Rhodococcus aetherivorans]QRI75628.1 ABC-F family ATP-binding cassette domain-containing protein [Rhodococcus aetherivorans]QSE59037.1 ABC-F family ATP-binding cassette domain-containing protein [Rhodococcus sp. PSBB066]QSE69641.1 ABC-F family ATP-binding casse